MRRAATLLTLLLAALPLARTAVAADGVFEINQACVSAGCFPGDGPGYPVTILHPGSYRLTGSLEQTIVLGVSSPTNAIQISSDDVQLDLGGFRISCRQAFGGVCGGSAAGILATLPARLGVRVANGVVAEMPGDGIDLSETRGAVVERVHARANGGNGIRIGPSGRVAYSTFLDNDESGILALFPSVEIVENTSTDNGAYGISTGTALVARNQVVGNDADGINASGGSTVVENVSAENGAVGILVSSSTVARNAVRSNGSSGIANASGESNIAGNTVISNGGAGIAANGSAVRDNVVGGPNGTILSGVDAGGNVCNGSLTCP